MTISLKLLTLAPMLTLLASCGNQGPINPIPTPPSTSQASSSAIDPLCHSLRVIAASRNDTRGTLDQISSDTAVKRAGCPGLR